MPYVLVAAVKPEERSVGARIKQLWKPFHYWCVSCKVEWKPILLSQQHEPYNQSCLGFQLTHGLSGSLMFSHRKAFGFTSMVASGDEGAYAHLWWQAPLQCSGCASWGIIRNTLHPRNFCLDIAFLLLIFCLDPHLLLFSPYQGHWWSLNQEGFVSRTFCWCDWK